MVLTEMDTKKLEIKTFQKSNCAFEVQALADLGLGEIIMSLHDTKNNYLYLVNPTTAVATKM